MFTAWFPDPADLQRLTLLHVCCQLLQPWRLCTQSHSTKDDICDLCTPHTTCCTSAFQDFFDKTVPVMNVDIHRKICVWTSSLPVNSFRHFPATHLHELASALWSLHDIVLAPISRLFSDQRLPQLTMGQLHHQPSSPPHWPIDTFLCVCYLLFVLFIIHNTVSLM